MVIAGLEREPRNLQVAGADLNALNEDELARLRAAKIGIVFQSFHLVPTMTALGIAAPPRILDSQRRRRACRAQEVGQRSRDF
jgi:putative ABC transport system ATP-binding protein